METTVVNSDLLRWIILAPLLGALLNGLIVRPKNAYVAGALASIASISAFFISCSLVFGHGFTTLISDHWFMWFEAGTIKVPFRLEALGATSIMLLVITGIGSLIHVYATSYMSHDESPWRFFSYLNLFLCAMLVLVLSSNLVGVFLGWEGVGLCSYLLIGFWYTKTENATAGMKAFVTNRIGDLGFLVALFVAISAVGTTDITELLKKFADPTSGISPTVWLVIASGLFWAACGKSAQFPLYVWLPDAMAGPTPVSALIHAATMVTSGIFVCVRLWPIFSAQPALLDVILCVGLVTAWLGALIALTQDDIKKVLAYSTVSQLGFMFVAIGSGSPVGGFFHVVTHACFKALLFLGAGSVIHGMHEEQNILKMGGLRFKMPLTHLTFLIGALAIIGFPLTAGFFSKDLILEKAFSRSTIAYLFLLTAAVMTAFYMLRVYALTFWGKGRSEKAEHAHESSLLITVPLVALAALSIMVGFIEIPDILGGVHWLTHVVESGWQGVAPAAEAHHEISHLLEWLLVFVATGFSVGMAWLSWKKHQEVYETARSSFVVRILKEKLYVDEIYDFLFLKPLAWIARISAPAVDGGILNRSVHVVRDAGNFAGEALSLFHTGNVQTYAWYLAAGAGATLLYFWMGV